MTDDIRKYRSIVIETVTAANPGQLSKHMSIRRYMGTIDIVFEITPNIQIDKGITITNINTYTSIELDMLNGGGAVVVEYSTNATNKGVTLREFYRGGYNDKIASILMSAGFSDSAAYSLEGSELGMQEFNLAHFDADLSDELVVAAGLLIQQDVVKYLNEIGPIIFILKFNVPSNILDRYAASILQFLLSNIDNTDYHDSLIRIINNLSSIVDWPELSTIADEINGM